MPSLPSAADIYRVLEYGLDLLSRIVIVIGTGPYYRFFEFNTRQPLIRLAEYANHNDQASKERLAATLAEWRERKLAEIQFVFVAAKDLYTRKISECGLIAAAIVSAFSWQNIATAYWLTSAFWSVGLVLSIAGLIMSAQQVAVLAILGPATVPATVPGNPDLINERYRRLLMTDGPIARLPLTAARRIPWRPRRKMIFLWQGSIMFMAYAVLLFLAGVTTYICTPLFNGEWDTGAYTGVIYLCGAGLALAAYTLCSFWIYHYVELPP